MTKQRQTAREWLKLTIAEPFPYFWAHVNYVPGTGPFYAAGSSWYHFPSDRAFAERQAAGLRAAGFTVTLETEVR